MKDPRHRPSGFIHLWGLPPATADVTFEGLLKSGDTRKMTNSTLLLFLI